jgi:hypothetical protein
MCIHNSHKTVTSQNHHSNPNFLSSRTSIPCIVMIIWSSHSVHVLHLLNDKVMSSIALENIQGKPQNKDLSSQLGWTLKWSLRLDCEESHCLLIQKSSSFVKRFCSLLVEIFLGTCPETQDQQSLHFTVTTDCRLMAQGFVVADGSKGIYKWHSIRDIKQ